ncbi:MULTISPECIES: hypothetical protein [unclassified Pseudomonas]|uniref:hypothetical protein n=1 Tax=unclassified Pseudomonas TaxID=196821 RepID=UPI0024482F47|nr:MULTISPECIES: hypothetical protein [unclassified Pseudomonas]MDG9928291.1 DUF1566 domain-containing protein [Pseudomonas sp. GD04042]MDH0481145.1 DUF1566 domain-containing protein [Pseudomonas sp. GD04015]MDH0604481.1 DUF1566 domain-containing protein [Pseudomonas sp. GD03869]
MKTIARTDLPAFGQPLEGGTLIARYWIGGQEGAQEVALVALPAEAELVGPWGEYRQHVPTTHGDGHANTVAMAEAGSALAKQALEIDAHIPSAFECHALMVAKQAGHLDDLDEDHWYWSSTQRSANYAFYMCFADGYQLSLDKDGEFRVRPVRRLLLQ